MTLPLLAMLLLQVLVQPVVVNEHVEHYDVTGSTAQAIRASLNRLGPAADDGKRFDAMTQWSVHYRWRYESTRQQCTVTTFSTTLDIRMLLPRWATPSRGPTLMVRWTTYMRALRRHEDGHADYGRRAAEAIRAMARTLRPAPTCEELDAAIRARADEIIDRKAREEEAYDVRTRHGATQGAVFG